MDLKFTKGTQRPSIKKASNITVPVGSIEKHSPELKSTSFAKDKAYWAHLRGQESEECVIRYYQNLKYELIAQRLKTPFAEVDLMFHASEGHVLIVEVKTINSAAFINARITKNQKQRLVRALAYLSDQMNAAVEIHWAFVTGNGEVTVIEDISG
jgi:putative endonuclease